LPISNWIELGLTSDEEAAVRRGAELHKTLHLDSFDSLFEIARGVEVLRRRYHGYGYNRRDYGDALVQYGYCNRDGGAMNKAPRSHLKSLLEHEAEVRAWWATVPERKKRDWLSAKAVFMNWQRSQRSADPDEPRRPSPYRQVQETNVALQEQLHGALAQIRTLEQHDGGSAYDPHSSTPREIARAISDCWRQRPKRIQELIEALQAELNELRGRHNTAQRRPPAG
jgi:hypothetical protein